jgi:transglutaminase-like putative cysteine protease
MPNLKLMHSLFFLVISLCCFSQTEDLYSALLVPDELKINANAIVRLNDLTVLIESIDQLSIVQKRIVTVLNEKGNSQVQAFSGYDKYNKIKKIEAKIFNETGKEIKRFKKNDFIDHSAVDGGTLYSDSRVLFLSYSPMSYPYTVEFLCEIETSNTAGVPTWRPISDYYVSIQKDIYTLKDNAYLGLRHKEKNLKDFNIKSSNTEYSLSYTLENNKAIQPEDLSPSFSNFTPQVLVAVENFYFYGVQGKAKNWLEFGDWINNSLLKGRNSVTKETEELVLNLTNDVSDPLEKAKKVFNYVQNSTRYISVQVGIGGVQPIPALEVDELKYGDCKGLTNYTQSLLEIAGVESYYSVVQAGNEIMDFEEDFASLEQGNHIILAIPNKDDMVWLDCTSQIHPFNFIGDFTDNRKVLVVKPNASEIIKTTTYPDTLNYQSTFAAIKLNTFGKISSDITRKTKGIQYDSRFTLERRGDKDVIRYYKEHWDYVNNLEVVKHQFINDKSTVEFVENIEVEANNYSSLTGERILFKPNIFNQNSYIPNRYRNRKLPLEISRGYLDEDTFSLTIPQGYEVEALPDNISIKNKFGEYRVDINNVENIITYKRRFLINKGKYPNTAYKDYRDFRKKVSKGDNSKIVLKAIK